MEKVRPWCSQPTLGSRTAKEQNRTNPQLLSQNLSTVTIIMFHSQTAVTLLLWFFSDRHVSVLNTFARVNIEMSNNEVNQITFISNH